MKKKRVDKNVYQAHKYISAAHFLINFNASNLKERRIVLVSVVLERKKATAKEGDLIWSGALSR